MLAADVAHPGWRTEVLDCFCVGIICVGIICVGMIFGIYRLVLSVMEIKQLRRFPIQACSRLDQYLAGF